MTDLELIEKFQDKVKQGFGDAQRAQDTDAMVKVWTSELPQLLALARAGAKLREVVDSFEDDRVTAIARIRLAVQHGETHGAAAALNELRGIAASGYWRSADERESALSQKGHT